MADTELNQLNDPELEQVVGGADDADDCKIYDSKGREIGSWVDNHARIGYWPCSKCGKPGHAGACGLHYCDPCNKRWVSGTKDWTGTQAELIAAADANF